MKRLINLAMSKPETRHWYRNQRKALKAFCKQQNWDYDTFADILAITSPRVQVKRNFRLACDYMQTKPFYTMPLPQIIAGLRHYEKTGKIRGPKTMRFARALKGDKTVVVLDIWMARILGVEYNHQFYQPKIYARLSRRIEKVADVLGWTPAETQAALWGNYLLSKGRTLYSYTNLIS